MVRLPKIGPIHPGLYITTLVLLAVALIIFLIGFLPGILRGGKRVTFTSPTAYSAVYVDGNYLGEAPVTAYISSGNHQVRLSFRDEFSQEFDFTVSHPLFFTWLFPRHQVVTATLLPHEGSHQELFLQFMLDEVAAWSAVLDFDERYHYPPRMSTAAQTLVQIEPSERQGSLIGDYFANAILYITSETLLKDAQVALEILAEAEVLLPLQQEKLQQDLAQIEHLFNSKASQVNHILSDTPGAVGTYEHLTAEIAGYRYPSTSLVIGAPRGMSFPAVVEMAQRANVASIAMGELETTEYQWALFMEANPMWAKDNKASLMELGLVDENYLQGIYPSTVLPSKRPIRNVSYYAALAYCQWLSEVSGQAVRLPSLAEWEYVAQVQPTLRFSTQLNSVSQSGGPAGLFGSVWELTSTAFVPLERYLQREATLLPTQSAQIVKGGSFLSNPASIEIATIGVQEPMACSSYTGFRVVW